MLSKAIQCFFPQDNCFTSTFCCFSFLLNIKLDKFYTLVTSLKCLIYPIPSCPCKLEPKVWTSKVWLILFFEIIIENITENGIFPAFFSLFSSADCEWMNKKSSMARLEPQTSGHEKRPLCQLNPNHCPRTKFGSLGGT